MYAVTDPIVKWDCEEDADEATGAESSSDEEDAEPGKIHSEPHPSPQTKILYETAYNTS